MTLDVDEGEILGLAGESGCGKSTMADAILRLLPATTDGRGSVSLNGEDVLTMGSGRLRAVRWARRAIVFQGAMHALNPVRGVGEQIVEAIMIHGHGEREGRHRCAWRAVRARGAAAPAADDYPHELSGGQKQRVMIAMALACSPTLVIADEPTTALDVMVQAQVLRLLKELQRELGLALLFITHDLSVLVEVSDRLAIMYAGKVVGAGAGRPGLLDPQHPYTEALAGAFPGSATSGSAGPDRAGRRPARSADVPSGCSFHPRCPAAFDECPTTRPAAVRGRRRPSRRLPARRARGGSRNGERMSATDVTATGADLGGAVLEIRELQVTFAGRVGLGAGLVGKKGRRGAGG